MKWEVELKLYSMKQQKIRKAVEESNDWDEVMFGI